jgi:IclR family transcriptional regulator, acetate operon repressor
MRKPPTAAARRSRAKAPAASTPRPRVQSAARTVDILLAIARTRDGARAIEISDELGLPRQVTYHLLHTLNSTGVIRKNPQNRYVLGLAAGVIADGFRRQLHPPEHLAPIVRSIATDCGETAYAVGWVDGEVVVLASARGESTIQAAEVPHGYSEDAHARASGKLLLALVEPRLRDEYLARHGLKPRTVNTLTSTKRLHEDFERIRARGYAVDEEEFSTGLCCLAVPVLDGRIAIGISVPAERFHHNLERYLATLRAAAKLSLAS